MNEEPTAEDLAWYLSATYVECADCEGAGEFYRRNFGRNAAEDFTFLGTCGTCNGTALPSSELS